MCKPNYINIALWLIKIINKYNTYLIIENVNNLYASFRHLQELNLPDVGLEKGKLIRIPDPVLSFSL